VARIVHITLILAKINVYIAWVRKLFALAIAAVLAVRKTPRFAGAGNLFARFWHN
jgi:hypothetical protein